MKDERRMEQELKLSEAEFKTLSDRLILAEKCNTEALKGVKNLSERVEKNNKVP